MKLAFRELGQGRPLIILHGLFGQSDNWNTLAKVFSESSLRVFTIDQRNHGLSPHSDTWDFEAMANDLKEFIDDHQLDRPILLGHSMGAKTVMFFELKYPQVSSKVILVDMAARAYGNKNQDVVNALLSVDLNSIESRKEAELALAKNISDYGTRQFLLKNIYRKSDGINSFAWRFNLNAISKNFANINVPVPAFVSRAEALIIKGELSDYINKADLQDYETRFPGYKLAVIPGAGHWVHAEKPKEFSESVLNFIKA